MAAIEYDPNRSANIALIHYVDGEKRYILAPSSFKVGEMIVASSERRYGDKGRELPSSEAHPTRHVRP